MFREAYRRDNEKIKPDPALLRHLEAKMDQAQQAAVPNAAAAPPLRRRWMKPAVAVAACLAVLIAAGIAYSGWSRSALPTAGTGELLDGTDYDQIYETVKAMEPRFHFGEWLNSLFGGAKNFADGSASGSAGGAPESNFGEVVTTDDPGHSETNTQVGGVDEADVTKTDGEYIYTLAGGRMHIVRADGGNLTTTAEIDYSDGTALRAFEFYVTADRLVLLMHSYEETAGGSAGGAEYAGCSGSGNVIWAAVYDIADRANPRLLNTLGQSGSYLSSRLVGDTLYLITRHSLPEKAKKGEKETYVPLLYAKAGCVISHAVMTAGDVCIPPVPANRQYTVVTSADIHSPQEHTSSKTILGAGDTLYASTENLLLAVPRSVRGEGGRISTVTDLVRFSLDGGKIALAASGTIPGTLLNPFSMDEYGGVFRVVTTLSGGTETVDGGVASYTPGETCNCLYTLDKDMQILGKVEGLARGEQVYSVRFLGDMGYFVTFRQVDPLFAVDLSDPAEPKVLSALKIPGFSNYLHPYAPGRLFGFGQQADPYTGAAQGLKLSMFDVSDPTDVTEIHTLPVDGYWSEAQYNHKAILVDAGRNLIGFSTDTDYYLYGYSDERGFYLRAQLPLSGSGETVRGLYIGDTFYTVDENEITAYSLLDFQQTGFLVL